MPLSLTVQLSQRNIDERSQPFPMAAADLFSGAFTNPGRQEGEKFSEGLRWRTHYICGSINRVHLCVQEPIERL